MKRFATGLAMTALLTLGAVALGGTAQATEPPNAGSSSGGTVERTTDGTVERATGGEQSWTSQKGAPPKLIRCLRQHGAKVVHSQSGKATIVFHPASAKKRHGLAKACGPLQRPDVKRVTQAKRFVDCVRENGVPELPAPGPDGLIRVAEQSSVDAGDGDLVRAKEICRSVA